MSQLPSTVFWQFLSPWCITATVLTILIPHGAGKKEFIPSCNGLPSSEEMVYTGEIAVHKSARSWGMRPPGSQFGNENLWILYIGIGLSLRKPRSQAVPTSSFCNMQNWKRERPGNKASVVSQLRKPHPAKGVACRADLVGSVPSSQCSQT